MLEFIWIQLFFRPLFNLLIYLYNNWTFFNLGVAIIYLTIILRIILLPLSIMGEKSGEFYKKLAVKIDEINRDYKDDSVRRKIRIREILKKNHVRPWAKTLVLMIQLLVLILLYQVFVGGIAASDKAHQLYPFIDLPDYINTKFFFFDIAQPNFTLTLIVAICLFLEITFTQRTRKEILTKGDLVYRLLFPVFTFFVLILLPCVKSLFILTSILFSSIIILIRNVFWKDKMTGTKGQSEIFQPTPLKMK